MLQYDEEIGRLYSCCDDKKVISWDVQQLKQIKAFDGHKDKVYREALYLEGRESLEGGILFAGDSTGTVYEWDIQRRELSHSWKAHEGSVWGMLMASFALISGGLDGMVKLWNPRTRELVRQLYRHNQSVCSFSVQADVFYSCAVDNIIKVWDWKDGTCLGTMHGHRETVANLCLTPEGTLFSSGIDKMVKVWKPPGSWGEEWHGLRELDLTTAGMVAEDVDRLEKQLRGEAAKWVSLSVSNNHLYDEGIGKLVKVSATDGHPMLSDCSLIALWLLSGCSLIAL
jgi:WD40 repeat protein